LSGEGTDIVGLLLGIFIPFLTLLLDCCTLGEQARAQADPHGVEHHIDGEEGANREEASEPCSLTRQELLHELVDHISLQLALEVEQEGEEGDYLATDQNQVEACDVVLHLQNDQIR
jgi:hypothetical protein